MAHSRLSLTTMYDWIERCLDAGESTPNDAAICERYGFDSSESARTLLAELADAGRITIRGYGETRKIALGRQRSIMAPAARPTPIIAKRDEDIERTAARLIEIAQRGRPSAAKVAASNAAALLSAVTAKPAAKKPAPPVQEEPIMSAKSIQIPASADDVIAAIEEHARRNDVSLGLATASLVKRGLSTGPTSRSPGHQRSRSPLTTCSTWSASGSTIVLTSRPTSPRRSRGRRRGKRARRPPKPSSHR